MFRAVSLKFLGYWTIVDENNRCQYYLNWIILKHHPTSWFLESLDFEYKFYRNKISSHILKLFVYILKKHLSVSILELPQSSQLFYNSYPFHHPLSHQTNICGFLALVLSHKHTFFWSISPWLATLASNKNYKYLKIPLHLLCPGQF